MKAGLFSYALTYDPGGISRKILNIYAKMFELLNFRPRFDHPPSTIIKLPKNFLILVIKLGTHPVNDKLSPKKQSKHATNAIKED